MTDDEALIHKQLGQEWERSVAIEVIAKLLLDRVTDLDAARVIAEAMLRIAEDERTEFEVRL